MREKHETTTLQIVSYFFIFNFKKGIKSFCLFNICYSNFLWCNFFIIRICYLSKRYMTNFIMALGIIVANVPEGILATVTVSKKNSFIILAFTCTYISKNV